MKEVLDRSNAYVLPVYARPPVVLASGKGAYVWDVDGRQYLDFSAGIAVNALGHGDEGLVEVSNPLFSLRWRATSCKHAAAFCLAKLSAMLIIPPPRRKIARVYCSRVSRSVITPLYAHTFY